jgi:hypothetical protein
VTTKLGAALREKFGDPKKLLEALGLDESVLDARKTERPMSTKPTRLAYAVLMNTAAAVNPLLAMDAKVNYAPLVAGLTTKNFKTRKPEIIKQLSAAVKGKLLAGDDGVSMNHVGKMLDHIEKEGGGMTKPETLDESVSPEQHNAMEAASHGHSNLGIPKDVGAEFAKKDDAKDNKTFDAGGLENLKGFMKEKGMSEDDIATGCDMMFKKTVGDAEGGKEDKEGREKDQTAVGDETPEEKAAREKKEGEDKALKDAADKAARDNMVTKDEMTKSISAAVNSARLNDRQTFAALDEVRPYVGELKGMSFDSAEKVYSHALKTLGVKVDGVHPSAFKTILDLQPKPGAKPAQQAHDSAPGAEAVGDFNKMFPGAERIVTA